MPAERLSMRQIREVLRLRFASKLSQRAIAKSPWLSQGAVSTYLTRARAAGIVWPLPDDLDDAQLEALLYPPAPAIAADARLGLGASRAAPAEHAEKDADNDHGDGLPDKGRASCASTTSTASNQCSRCQLTQEISSTDAWSVRSSPPAIRGVRFRLTTN